MDNYIESSICLDHEGCTGYVFKIKNEEDFANAFSMKSPFEIYYNEAGKRIAKGINKVMLQAIKDGKIGECITASYSDEGIAVFDYIEATMDDFGAVTLWYEYRTTVS